MIADSVRLPSPVASKITCEKGISIIQVKNGIEIVFREGIQERKFAFYSLIHILPYGWTPTNLMNIFMDNAYCFGVRELDSLSCEILRAYRV